MPDNIFKNIPTDTKASIGSDETSKAPKLFGAVTASDSKPNMFKPSAEGQRNLLISNVGSSPAFTGSEKEYNQLAEYGAQPNQHQDRSDLELVRAKNQSAWTQAGNALIQTVGTVVGDTVGGVGMLLDVVTFGTLDDKPFSNLITRAGDAISDYVRNDLAPIYRENPDKAFDMQDFSGWFFSQLPSVASSLSLMIPGAAFGKGVTMLGKTLGKTLGAVARHSDMTGIINKVRHISKLDNAYKAQRAAALYKDGITAIGMRLGENYQEARGVAEQINQEAIDLFSNMSDVELKKWMQDNPDIAEESGGDINEAARLVADKAAMRNFGYNSFNVVFDFMQLRALNKMLGQVNRAITPRLRHAQNQALDRLAATGVEGASQTLGQAAKGTIKGIGGKLNRLINSSENLLISELSEGVEEAVNYVGQEEGTAYGRYLLNQLEDYNGNTVSLDRIANYLKDPQLYNSALWGVIGGIVFGGTMSAINNRKGGISDEKMRTAEITSREQVFSKYKDSMDKISNGLNPFEYERDSEGNVIYRLDDGTISLDSTVGTPTNVAISPEEQATLADEVRTRFASTLTLNAIRAGNYELLEDYVNDTRLKKKLIDSGLATEESYDADTEFINSRMRDTLEKYKSYSTAMRSANIEDTLLDIAISENIFSAVEADLLDKRIQKIQEVQSELERADPDLAKASSAIQSITIGRLQQYRKEAYEIYNATKDSKNPTERLTASTYKDLINTIERKIESIADEDIYFKVLKKEFDKELGLPDNPIVEKEIEKFLSEEKSSYDEALKRANKIYDADRRLSYLGLVNKEYADNLDLLILHELNRDNYKNKIAITNEAVQQKAKELKEEQERAAKLQIDTANRSLNSYISVATDEQLALLDRILNNAVTEEDNKNPNARTLVNAIGIIKSSKDRDKLLEGIKNNIAKTRIHNEKVRKAEESTRKDTSTGEGTPSTTKSPSTTTPAPTPTPVTKEEKELKATLDKVVESEVSNLVTSSNIESFTFKVNKPFASIDYMNQKPIKVANFDFEISKFGNLSINGRDKNNNLIADVTLEELNAAIANGEVEATVKSSDDANVLESAIPDVNPMQQRYEELKLIINLYNTIQGNKIDGKAFTSINDLMVYLQRLNPNAIKLFDDVKLMANRLIADGIIVGTDNEYKSASEIVAESKQTLDKVINERRKESNEVSYYFDLINLDDSKVYTQIGKLKSGNTVTVKLEGDELVVRSQGKVIGKMPTIRYKDGNVNAVNSGWNYTITNDEIPFITRLRKAVTSNDADSKEFLTTLNNIRRLFKVRENPEIASTFNKLLAILEVNQTWKNLDSLYGEKGIGSRDEMLTKINHLNNIIFFNYNVDLNTPQFSTIADESLANWSNKIKKSYTDINNLRSSLAKTKNREKRLAIKSTSTGSLIYAKDGRGNPIYSNIADVTTADATNGFQLVRGGDNSIVDIKTNQVIEASGIRRGVVGIVVKDSEGRLMTAPTRENTMDNGFSKGTAYTKAFNEGIDRLFHALLQATHSGNTVLHDTLLKELDRYIGNGKPLFGYRIQGHALIPNIGRTGAPTIYFNVQQDNPNVRIIYPDGTKKTLSAFLPGTNTRPTNTVNNFAKIMTEVYSTITRNVINTAVTNKSDMFRMNNGKLEARIPNVEREEWLDTGYSSYEEFVAKDGVVVTDLGSVKDKKGNIISNFNYVNDKFNKRITLVSPVRSKENESNTVVPSPVEVSSPAETPNPNVATDASSTATTTSNTSTGSITEIANKLTTDAQLLSVVSALESAGLKVSTEFEENDKRFASIVPGSNVLTLTTRWQKLDNTQKVLKIIHEGVHFLLNDERSNIEKSFGDLYDKFKKWVEDMDMMYAVEYIPYLNEGKPRQVQIEEFIAEALTSRTLAKALAEIKYDSNSATTDNLFTKIIDALVGIIQKITNIDGTVLGEIRSRLAAISNDIVTNDGTTADTLLDTEHLAEDTEVPIGDDIDDSIPDFTDIDGMDLLDSAITDNYNQVDNFDSYVAGLSAREKAVITRLFNAGELSFVCE